METIKMTSKELSIKFADQVIAAGLFAEDMREQVQIQSQDGFGVMFHDDPEFNAPTILFPHESLSWKDYRMKNEYLEIEKMFICENTNSVCYNEYLKNSCVVSD